MIPQASLLPLSISVAVIVPFPKASNFTVALCVIAIGSTLSSTVTVAVWVETLSLLSITVNVTVFKPTLAQLKEVVSKASDLIPQASLLPLSISVIVIVPFPAASNSTVALCVIAIGSTLSSTVTVAICVETLSLLSVTVNVTVFKPTFSQLKEVVSNSKDLIPQASFDPLSISSVVIVALPEASSWTVVPWEITVGEVLSSTITSKVQLEVFPEVSVAVAVTAVTPTLKKLPEEGLNETDASQLSVAFAL